MVNNIDLDPILSERELAEWLGELRPTLQRQRADESGPPFIQLSKRRIGYRKSAVERWLETRTIGRLGVFSEQSASNVSRFEPSKERGSNE